MSRPVPPLHRHYSLQHACRVPDDLDPSWDGHYQDEYPPMHEPFSAAYFVHVDKSNHAFIARTYSEPTFVAAHSPGYVACGDVALCYGGVRYATPQALYEQVLSRQLPDRTGRQVRTHGFDATYGHVWQITP